jgi:hypothetical protein
MLEAVWLMLVLQGVMPLLPKLLSTQYKVVALGAEFLVLGEQWVAITQLLVAKPRATLLYFYVQFKKENYARSTYITDKPSLVKLRAY